MPSVLILFCTLVWSHNFCIGFYQRKTQGLQLRPVSDFWFPILQLFLFNTERKGQLKIIPEIPDILLKEATYYISKSNIDNGWTRKINSLINPLNTAWKCSDKTYYYNIWESVRWGYILNFIFMGPILTEIWVSIVKLTFKSTLSTAGALLLLLKSLRWC